MLALDAHSLEEVIESVVALAEALGVAERGRERRARDARADRRGRGARARRAASAAVCVAEWLDPPYAAGHWIPEMVALAGGREVLGRAGAPSYPTTWETVRAAAPASSSSPAPCGYDHERAAREAALPAARLPRRRGRRERLLRAARAASRRRRRAARVPDSPRARARTPGSFAGYVRARVHARS